MIRGDVIDYSRVYTQKWLKEHPFLEVDRYPTLYTGITDFTQFGWEEDTKNLYKTCCLMTDADTGRIEAVGVYAWVPQSAKPMLLWIHPESCRLEPRFYEIEYAEFLAKERQS